MKKVKKNDNGKKSEIITEYIKVIEQYVVFAYLFCMLGIFPLYYKEQYYKIGNAKFDFFWNTSLCFIGISFVFVLLKIVLQQIIQSSYYKSDALHKKSFFDQRVSTKETAAEEENILIRFLDNLSALDYAVFIYGICVLLSYAFSDFKDYALKGAAGWEMGLCSQMIFVAIYFILSRQKMSPILCSSGKRQTTVSNLAKQKEPFILILWIHLIASALTFGFGILHRFDMDPLGMYVGLDLYQKIEFLSTIGQATWFSSYVCTVFAAGVVLFYVSKKTIVRIFTGIYLVISFGILVTQNSDSAFMAIAGIMLLLGYFSLNDIEKWCRFWQIMCLMWGTFGGIGILQKVFADRAIPLDSLSIFFSQSVVTWIMFAVSLAVMLFFRKCYKTEMVKKQWRSRSEYDDNTKDTDENSINTNGIEIMKITRKIYQGVLLLFVAAVIITIFFIYLNTKGYLLEWFGYQSTNEYLFFDYHWGSNRGSTWMICWQSFWELPWFQKLFGVGPDSLSAYLYSVSDISDLLHSLWGSIRLTNAHNEYLNSLICYGIVGLASWLAVLIGGIVYFYRKAKENPFMMAFALCIVGYACHNLFCYQQVCCTPFLFIVLGIGESLTKSENFNTIK